ncbi:hypothetical protein A3722_00250 [Sulfitobacter sp. HI0027]|uniref:hypothetical protein n=1 Tax=Sulfitobacter sp. HI0027 TaxID=1822226 RepID=UPI0007C33E26|nr:hypothetical protein [Sulfitobacter sp. HI0027]KZY02481.1 hypothetical protein A3722_00250 [Sulfitobacter sp. HI0027]
MGYRFSKGWNSKDDSWSTDGAAGSGCDASGTKSYHNGGVEGSSFAKWYDENLAGKFDGSDDGKGSGSGGTKGSGSGGTKGTGSGGTKGTGSGGTKGSGTGGTKGSGSGGTKGSGSGGTKGSGSGGTKGSGSGGTKGSGSGGTKGSGSGGTKGSGSGGTKGSGSGGTKGSGSGGTKGSGSGGTQGSDTGGDDKTVLKFLMGENGETTVAVTEMPNGELHFNLSPTDPEAESHADINGLFFNVTDGSAIEELNFFPDVNAEGYHLTDVKAVDDGVDGFTDGPQAGGNFDVGLQFGTTADSSEGEVSSTNFTLWTYPGSLSFEDIDLSGMRLVVDSDETGGEVLEVTGMVDPDMADPDAADTSDGATALMDALSLASMPSEEDEEVDTYEDDAFDMA